MRAMDPEELIDDFEMLGDWEERYRYLIDLGSQLPPLADEERTEENRVRGCMSQVWLVPEDGSESRLRFRGDSDAHIVRGLVALMVALFDGRTPREAAETDAFALYTRLGLAEHLTPQRSNGVRAMADRIHRDATALAA